MVDEVWDDDPEGGIGVVPTPDWVGNNEEVQGFTGIKIPALEARRAYGEPKSVDTPKELPTVEPTPAQPEELATPPAQPDVPHDPESDGALEYDSRREEEREARRKREEEKEEEEARLKREEEKEARRKRKAEEEEGANREAAARARRALIINPKPVYVRRNAWKDPQMHGDAAEVTIKARTKLMETAKPRTFVLPEKGALVCSGKGDDVLTLEDGNAKLPTLGKDFGYNPEEER